jgi:copper(I)-binding protein
MSLRTTLGLLIILLTGCRSVGKFEVIDAWARVPLPSKNDTVAYLTLSNHTPNAQAIVSASSLDAGKVEMHEMTMNGSMMSMGQVARIALPAGGKAVFSAAGYHLMIFGLKKSLRAGDTLNVTLTLDDGTNIPVRAIVRAND